MPFTLCYHAVSDTWDHPLAVPQETLVRQLSAAIRWGWKPAATADLVAGKPRSLNVTFDDAYRSILPVLPSLDRLGIRPTVFVCSAYAGEGQLLDLAPLDDLPAAYRNELATLRWDELRGLVERGIEIGSHTRTHPNLRELSTSELWREVAASRDEIESELGCRCRYFAYPYGQFDDRVQRAVERAGYEAAFGLIGVGRPGGRFGIARVESSRGDGDLRILLKSSSAWPPVSRVLRRMRGSLARLEPRYGSD